MKVPTNVFRCKTLCWLNSHGNLVGAFSMIVKTSRRYNQQITIIFVLQVSAGDFRSTEYKGIKSVLSKQSVTLVLTGDGDGDLVTW